MLLSVTPHSISKEIFTTALVGLPLMLALAVVSDFYTITPLVIFGLLAFSLGLIWGYGGILCFGQAVFFGLGAYTYVIAAINFGESTLPFFLAIVLPAGFAFLFGIVIFYGRLSDVYVAVITLVVTLIFQKSLNVTAGSQYVIGQARLGGYNGIPGFPTLNFPGEATWLVTEDVLYYFSFVLLLVVFVLVKWLILSPFGRVCVGIRENETRMELVGYDVARYKTLLFTVSGAIAGLAGCLYANYAEIVTPTLFSMGFSAEITIWVIVGGLRSFTGPIMGACFINYLKVLLAEQTYLNNLFVTGMILVLVVLLLPEGIVPSLLKVWKKFRARHAPKFNEKQNIKRRHNRHA